ncbi:unnamed protein product [Calicophoron daubneyi]|uniref:Tektin n=1 Tax=Calicophoron daubneyi TaxID=300641 RepID=A0AAV2T8B4_CALDB
MATISKPDFKNTYPNWFTKLHAQSRAAQDARNESTRLREVNRCMRIETDAKTKYDQRDTNNRLADRIWTTRQWRDALAAQLKRLKERMADLKDAKRLTEDYQVKLADAQQVNVECLVQIDHRRQGEFILDPVETELTEERTLLGELYKDLQAQTLDAFEALVGMQESVGLFYRDLEDKKNTMSVDIEQYNLNELSAHIGYKPFCTRKPEKQLDLQSWEDISRNTLDRARKEVEKGRELIHRLHLGLHQAADRMAAKDEKVASALRMRIHDTKRAIRELEFQVKATEDEKEKLIKEIKNLEEALRAKHASLKLAQTRLEGRQNRPGNDNNDDAPQFGLRDELSGLTDSIDALEEQIAKARAVLGRLDKQLAILCQEISMKQETAHVYQEVVNIRKRLEKPTLTRFPPCPLIPQGIVRQPTVF